MSRKIFILNGPNLNLLGQREPEIYGRETLADIEADCRRLAPSLGLTLEFRQSNAEGTLVDWIHEARTQAAGLVLNAGAYTHTSIALLDALKSCTFPIMEVHLSNVHQRESFRHHSYISSVATGIIIGCGAQGYQFALQRLGRLLEAVSPGR